MTSRGKHLIRFAIALLLIGAVTTNCTWFKRMRTTPRKHWWEIWKPKAPKTDFIYPGDLGGDPIPPEPPPIIDTTGLPNPDTLPPAVEPVDINTTPDPLAGIEPTTISRKQPTGMLNELQTVYFDYDSSLLKAEAQRTLDQNAQFLIANPQVRVLIEGHCDERGTQEYNLNLGQRRADTVREYLITKGVRAEQLETISFGEERPEDPGNSEAAWAKNRRAQFMIY